MCIILTHTYSQTPHFLRNPVQTTRGVRVRLARLTKNMYELGTKITLFNLGVFVIKRSFLKRG